MPDNLWHADVCHGMSLKNHGRTTPLRVHAILDDASHFIVAIRAFSSEREVDMLELLVQALRRAGPPQTLYLDNGSTYRGEALSLACVRMGIRVVHASISIIMGHPTRVWWADARLMFMPRTAYRVTPSQMRTCVVHLRFGTRDESDATAHSRSAGSTGSLRLDISLGKS